MELSSCPVPASINDESLESWQLIGSGGFGKIYKAKHTKWGTNVAIKLLRCNDGSDSSLLQEADLMRHGGNPNVLRIFGVYVGCPHGQPCPTQLGLVMEYMERGSVADLQQAVGGPPPWPLAFRIMHQIALGMNFLHQLSPPLLHLDLKPSNVLLDDSLNAKLTDFGLAKLAQSRSNVDREQDEEVGGTTSYMPPEAFQPSSYTPAFSSDVYSYGVLLWSVMTGKPPYYTPLSSLVRFRVTEGDRPDLGSVDSSQAHGLSNLIDLMKLCWHADPTQRPTFMKCVNVTEKVYDFHKRKVHNAVCAILENLDNSDKISSSFKSLGINPKMNNAIASIKEKSHHSVKTPTQEKSEIVISQCTETGSFARPRPPPTSRTNHKPAAIGSHTTHKSATKRLQKVLTTQRQFSTPSTVSICLSNVTGVQIGNNNHMNINHPLDRQRNRHQTAPSSVSLPNPDWPPRSEKNP
ncbi:receptor-interacting serine/threonine-protein kinase 4 isoform X1 [Electrophorus electricus]|uniref:Protein kinase domain-containing protein n=2 Tax=Electrophorus electricus TaxID=8005 RepID=A0A4W4HS72_ELEEL|nr:receptor-interacting serine/threonine-protein kinase 4 isoform X1 [Electrophorus electricus]